MEKEEDFSSEERWRERDGVVCVCMCVCVCRGVYVCVCVCVWLWEEEMTRILCRPSLKRTSLCTS